MNISIPLAHLYKHWQSQLPHKNIIDRVTKIPKKDFVFLQSKGWKFLPGKVRDCFLKDSKYLMFHTDRLSAFDQFVGSIPYRGEILCALSSFFFRSLPEYIPHHFRHMHHRYMLTSAASPLPVEVIVRSAFTGSLWRAWKNKENLSAYAQEVPLEQLKHLPQYAPLPRPIVHLTTKAKVGSKDIPICAEYAIKKNLLSYQEWEFIQKIALKVFEHGQNHYAQLGLYLADTKFEFARLYPIETKQPPSSSLVLIDEILTPDSSRIWKKSSMQENNIPIHSFDKDIARDALSSKSKTDSNSQHLSQSTQLSLAQNYLQVCEGIIGSPLMIEKSSTPLEEIWEQIMV